MSQPSTSTLPTTAADLAVLSGEPLEAIAESDVVLDEDAWRALLIQIDREEGGP
jgi:hypothetical protein